MVSIRYLDIQDSTMRVSSTESRNTTELLLASSFYQTVLLQPSVVLYDMQKWEPSEPSREVHGLEYWLTLHEYLQIRLLTMHPYATFWVLERFSRSTGTHPAK